MSKDKPPPDAPQLFPRSLKELKRSPIWRQWQEANAKLRESLPPLQCTPQQLRTPRLPADRLVDAIAARARTEANQDLEPEQAPQQQAIEQPPERTIEQATQAPSRPRHRPRIEFPHLDEALAALEKEPHWKSMQLKEEIAFVMAFLREHGDNVTDDQDKTVGRRIGRWRATRAKRTH